MRKLRVVAAILGQDGAIQRRNSIRGFWKDRFGGFSIILAISLPIILVFVSFVLDYGNVYAARRNLQNAADIAALEASQKLPDRGAAETAARQAIAANFPQDENVTVSVEFGGLLDRDSATGEYIYPVTQRFVPDTEVSGAVRVQADRDVPGILSPLVGINRFSLAASAVAANVEEGVTLRLATTAASVDTTKSALLNAVMQSLLPETRIGLDAIGWQGLLDSHVRLLTMLDMLSQELSISLVDVDSLLASDIELPRFLDVLARAMDRDADELGGQRTAIDALRLLGQQTAGAPPIVLGDLLQLSDGSLATPGLEGEVLPGYDVVNAALQIASHESGLSSEVNVGLDALANVALRAQITQPPRILIRGREGSSVAAAQIRVLLHVRLLNLNLSGLPNGGNLQSGSVVDLPIYLDVAAGRVTIDGLGCSGPAEDRYVDVAVETSPLDIQIGQMSEADIFEEAGAVVAAPAPIINVTFPAVGKIAEITVHAASMQPGGARNLRVQGPFDPAVNMSETVSQPVTSLTSAVLGDLALEMRILPGANGASGVNALLGNILRLTLAPLQGLITDTLASVLDQVLAPLLTGLGAQVGVVDFSLENLTCERGRLVI